MKNTVKKILALVFVVAMVCSLAVPAFAANDYVDASIKVLNANGDLIGTMAVVENDKIAPEKATIESVLRKADNKSTTFALTFKNGQINSVTKGTTVIDAAGKLLTGKWAVALNGKTISEDLGTVTVSENDEIVIYVYDSSFGTKLAQYDASRIDEGIISFYYYNNKGEKKPLNGATVTLNVLNLLKPVDGVDTKSSSYVTVTDADNQPVLDEEDKVVTSVVTETYKADETDEYGLLAATIYNYTYTADEQGQIWIAPQFLVDGVEIEIEGISISKASEVKKNKFASKGWTVDEGNWYNNNRGKRQFAEGNIVGDKVQTAAIYNEAGATGDMTVAYVMVAAAAVITLGAVVIMKKKAVKAN